MINWNKVVGWVEKVAFLLIIFTIQFSNFN